MNLKMDELYDVTKPRDVPCRTKWKENQNAVFWFNQKSAQDNCFAFWPSRSDAIIIHDSVPAKCLEKAVNTKTEEIFVSESFLVITTSTTKNSSEGFLASSTRRPRSTVRQYRESCCRRDDERFENGFQNFKVYHVPKLNKRKKIVGNN